MNLYKKKTGILIALEGIDGVGKTTQVIRLEKHYQKLGSDVVRFKEPTDGPYGKEIKNLASNGRHTVSPEQELELFIKDRIEDCEYNIRPALNNSQLVLVDRYYFSSIAYQGALGLDINYIRKRNEDIAILPDLVIILDISVKEALKRIKIIRNDTINHFEKAEYLEEVRLKFKKMKEPYIKIIDGSSSMDDVFNAVNKQVESCIRSSSTILSR